MRTIATMIVRNEADRHLVKALDTAVRAADVVRIVDDCSDDNTVELIRAFDSRIEIHVNDEPTFWRNESEARQAAYNWATQDCEEGDWILALDADETLNKPELVHEQVQAAEALYCGRIMTRLYEFWTPTQYRVDGFWFGTNSQRLFAWQPKGRFSPNEFACGSEPLYVRRSAPLVQRELNLLHWGYLNKPDRQRKYNSYRTRAGGHGHNNKHIESIVTRPVLETYYF